MANIIPFKTGAELKTFLSGINITLDIGNIQSSFVKAIEDVSDVVSDDVWKLIIDHYNSEHFGDGGEYQKLDDLVKLAQYALANFGMFHHFIWLTISISNSSVTVKKSEDETTAYKYLTDEAKQSLIDTAWVFMTKLIEYLNANATVWTAWEKTTSYQADQIVRYNDTFYKANAQFTSGESFAVANWTVKPDSEVIFHKWTLSDQYTELQNEIFESYKDFQKYFDISRSAYFYAKLRHIINRVKDDYVNSRLFQKTSDSTVIRTLKRAVAYKTMSIATMEFDYFMLPKPLRVSIGNEMQKNARFRDVSHMKQVISERYNQIADQYFEEFERAVQIDRESESISEKVTQPYTTTLNEDKSHASMM
ncbi:MAG: hypothetical protein PF448_13100 [Bacteroidales bacterium]|jgi:hypothetical protein|nr:hypothetical protein [Bacteroidales bacterium]